MPIALVNDELIDEMLTLARVKTADAAPRRWIQDALGAAQGIAAGERWPAPAKHNAPLNGVEKAAARLLATLNELREHPHAYGSFWRFSGFGPVQDSKFERPKVVSAIENIRLAAESARMHRTGRRRDLRKQHIVDLALAFCARFSPRRPSSDGRNFFPAFAQRFYELATGFSVEDETHGIERQIRVALRRLPIELERRRNLLNETGRKQLAVSFFTTG